MAQITRKLLEDRVALMEVQRDEHLKIANESKTLAIQLTGAIQDCKFLIKELAKPDDGMGHVATDVSMEAEVRRKGAIVPIGE